jgi:hypothetical protein
VRSKKTLATLVALSLGFATAATAQNNVLVNGDFELNPPPKFGNNVDYSIFPWVLGTGDQSNVVKVDGPGTNFNYGSNGPESDASAPGAGVPQHYLDIVGQNNFYQSFTPQCTGEVQFGGSFSTRANSAGTATVSLVEGVGASGTVIQSNTVNLPGGNSRTDPWTLVTFTAPVAALQTYSLVIDMDNQLNFDNGFARFVENCELPDPCCPPWTSALLESMLFYQGTGSIGAPYRLKFTSNPVFRDQMQAYIDYVQTRNPLITTINIAFRLHDAGTGSTPVSTNPALEADDFVWWIAGQNGTQFGTPDFFATPLKVNRWYRVQSGIYLNDLLTFFPFSCAEKDVYVRVQVLRSALKGVFRRSVLQIRLPNGEVVEKSLQATGE